VADRLLINSCLDDQHPHMGRLKQQLCSAHLLHWIARFVSDYWTAFPAIAVWFYSR